MMYPAVCACGFRGEIMARATDCDRLKCPACNGFAEQDWSAKLPTIQKGSREFRAGRDMSYSEGVSKADVGDARKVLGAIGERCIRDDGRVVFKDTAERNRYLDAKNAVQATTGKPFNVDPTGTKRAINE